MQDVDLLIEWIVDIELIVKKEIETLSQDQIDWQPTDQMNSIGHTIWHFSRWLDVILVRGLQNQPPSQEQWYIGGWKDKTGYDPNGKGYRGFGAITGFTWKEVQDIPLLSANDLLTYLSHVCNALKEHLQTLESEVLHRPTPGLNGERTAYGWLRPVIQGCLGHIGEIQTLKTLQTRTRS
jgi:DinB family protein